MARPARVRPSNPRDEHFEDLPVSANVSKDGIYFTTHRNSYYKGMRVFVTFPYSSPHDPINCEYVAEVVRVEELTKGKFGVALHLKLSVTYGDSTRSGSLTAPDLLSCHRFQAKYSFNLPLRLHELQGGVFTLR
jgi:hypothetical protein